MTTSKSFKDTVRFNTLKEAKAFEKLVKRKLVISGEETNVSRRPVYAPVQPETPSYMQKSEPIIDDNDGEREESKPLLWHELTKEEQDEIIKGLKSGYADLDDEEFLDKIYSKPLIFTFNVRRNLPVVHGEFCEKFPWQAVPKQKEEKVRPIAYELEIEVSNRYPTSYGEAVKIYTEIVQDAVNNSGALSYFAWMQGIKGDEEIETEAGYAAAKAAAKAPWLTKVSKKQVVKTATQITVIGAAISIFATAAYMNADA